MPATLLETVDFRGHVVEFYGDAESGEATFCRVYDDSGAARDVPDQDAAEAFYVAEEAAGEAEYAGYCREHRTW